MLDEGALQPVIGLLSSACTESQREAALLLGQFATTDPDYKTKIVQRGAVPPLIEMLGHHDPQLKEMAAFALGRLAQNSENQAGIVQARRGPCMQSLCAGSWTPALPALCSSCLATQTTASSPVQRLCTVVTALTSACGVWVPPAASWCKA